MACPKTFAAVGLLSFPFVPYMVSVCEIEQTTNSLLAASVLFFQPPKQIELIPAGA